MKDWIKKRIKECNAKNIIIFPLREEDVERRIRNAKMDSETLKNHEELLVSLELERRKLKQERKHLNMLSLKNIKIKPNMTGKLAGMRMDHQS